ncbi:hypothetical protein V6N13_148843 [Hibiscus sabdariffa]
MLKRQAPSQSLKRELHGSVGFPKQTIHDAFPQLKWQNQIPQFPQLPPKEKRKEPREDLSKSLKKSNERSERKTVRSGSFDLAQFQTAARTSSSEKGKQADHSGSIESDQVGAEQVDSGAIQQITDQECPVQSMSAPTTSAQVECGSADCTQEEWSTDCEQTDYGQASNGRVVFGCHEQLCQGTRMNGDEVNLAEGTA